MIETVVYSIELIIIVCIIGAASIETVGTFWPKYNNSRIEDDTESGPMWFRR